MTLSIPVEVHETEYHLESYGKGTTEFQCSHLHIHKEEATGEFWEREGLAEYTGYTWICDNCDEVIENVAEDGCNE